MGLLNDKTCVVTGGAGSLGLAAARLLLQEGARVMLIDHREAELRRAADGLGSAAVAVAVADVTSSDSVRAAIEATVAQFGLIDVLFSNAGNFGTVKPISEYPLEVFEAVYSVHVKGAFLMCKHAVPNMNDGASIIITSSVAGTRGDPGVYGYITAKHAQVGLMRCLAKELAPRRIRVNTIHPGPIQNDFQHRVEHDLSEIIGRNATEFFDSQIPLGRHATADEVARSVVYLASEQSSFTTGAMLMVDGGMSA